MKAAILETALIAQAPDAIIFADRAGVIRLWNQAAEALFGHSAADIVGHTLDLIIPELSRTAHWAGFFRAVQLGRFAKDEVLLTSRALTKDGRIIAVELSAAIIRSDCGQVQGIMAIGRDVTERAPVSRCSGNTLLVWSGRWPHSPTASQRLEKVATRRAARGHNHSHRSHIFIGLFT